MFVCRQSNVSEPTVNVAIKIEERLHIHGLSIKVILHNKKTRWVFDKEFAVMET